MGKNTRGRSEEHRKRFGGLERLYGVPACDRLANARVAVIGVGGVGSWTVEALARSGVRALTLVDLDEVCVNNANRQLHALDGEVGKLKVEVMKERALRIHPGCEVHAEAAFFTERTADRLLAPGFDVVIDAIDTLRHKILLVALCHERGIPVVVAGGAGGRRDPTRIRMADLSRTTNDGLLRNLRRELRRQHGFSRDRAWGIPAVFSDEPPTYPGPDGTVCDTAQPGGPKRLDCATGYGTVSFVCGTFGFALAGAAVDLIVAPPLST